MTTTISRDCLSRRAFLALAGSACMAAACVSLPGCSQRYEASSASAGSDAHEGLSAELEARVADEQSRTLFVFDTVVTLSCYCTAEVMDAAVDRCNYFESIFSRTIEGSDVYKVNHAQGAPTEVSSETADIIGKALEYCKRSGGLFDITIGSVSSLWDFTEGVKPSETDIAEALQHVDYRKVSIEGATVQLKDPQAMIDLGGIAKGYIADDLARLFREGGCESGIINLGGNAYVIGTKPDGSDWNVGVQDPNGAAQTVIAKIACSNASVVTSGLYEREFVQDGISYYHILDPATGYPVETDLVSSSVYSKSSLDGDAYATWMFLLGHDGALSLLNETPDLEGLVVDETGAISMTDNAAFQVL